MSKRSWFGQSAKTAAETDPRGPWFFCLKHHAVESYEGCKALDRLGPYEVREDAEQALARVAERNQAWDGKPDPEEES
jgi:hypothetical protein